MKRGIVIVIIGIFIWSNLGLTTVDSNIISNSVNPSRPKFVSNISLEKGDIVFADITNLAKYFGGISLDGESNDHVAIYAGHGFFGRQRHIFQT